MTTLEEVIYNLKKCSEENSKVTTYGSSSRGAFGMMERAITNGDKLRQKLHSYPDGWIQTAQRIMSLRGEW